MNIKGDRVILRALEPGDMELLRETVNDPEMEKMVVGWSFPVSVGQQMAWYDRIMGDTRNYRFAIVLDGEFAGLSTLTDIDWKNRSAFHGIKLTLNAPKGKGVATDAVYATMRYAFEELQLNRLYGGILEYNMPSRKLYEKCGWKVEGIYRQCVFKENAYYDEYAVAILREEYFEWKKNRK